MMTPTVSRRARRRGRLQLRRVVVQHGPPGWLDRDCSWSRPDELETRLEGGSVYGGESSTCGSVGRAGDGQQGS